MLLLLVLLAGCSVLSAAQTLTTPGPPTPPELFFPPDIVAVLMAAIQSTQELNMTNIGPTMQEVQALIQELAPGMNFSLTVKKIIKV
ncbi:hypothetical protein PBY51_021033 [Eleginops maclovinus]|uniref:Uncharacterized protein n=1 Tax=Eleginops maclovinus TaxID=56733 RepID=A0AAN7XF60_ELEMC|nr:hypothetical protein PBY51_021033 [Eleginops maclovinus]